MKSATTEATAQTTKVTDDAPNRALLYINTTERIKGASGSPVRPLAIR